MGACFRTRLRLLAWTWTRLSRRTILSTGHHIECLPRALSLDGQLSTLMRALARPGRRVRTVFLIRHSQECRAAPLPNNVWLLSSSFRLGDGRASWSVDH
jgi:hypothetical protein